MPDERDISDDEIDSWLEEWEAVDRAAVEYLAERIPGVLDVLSDDEASWLDALAETISPSEEPEQSEIESVSAVMALQHADWLGLAVGVVHRGPGSALDPVLVQGTSNGSMTSRARSRTSKPTWPCSTWPYSI